MFTRDLSTSTTTSFIQFPSLAEKRAAEDVDYNMSWILWREIGREFMGIEDDGIEDDE